MIGLVIMADLPYYQRRKNTWADVTETINLLLPNRRLSKGITAFGLCKSP